MDIYCSAGRRSCCLRLAAAEAAGRPGNRRGRRPKGRGHLGAIYADIENGNDELIELVSGIKQEHAVKQASLQEQVAELRNRIVELERQAAIASVSTQTVPGSEVLLHTGTPHQAVAAYGQFRNTQTVIPIQAEQSDASIVAVEDQTPLQEVEPEAQQESIRERYQELFELYEQGKSVDYIAKQSGIQRGEVQLILQLAEREDLT